MSGGRGGSAHSWEMDRGKFPPRHPDLPEYSANDAVMADEPDEKHVMPPPDPLN